MKRKIRYALAGVMILGVGVGIVVTISNGKKQISNTLIETNKPDNSLVYWDYGKEAVTVTEHERAVLDEGVWNYTKEDTIYMYCCDTKEIRELRKEDVNEYISLPEGTYKLYYIKDEGSQEDISSFLSVETYYNGTEEEGIIPVQ